MKVVKTHSLESINFLAKIHVENMTSLGRKAKSEEFYFEFLSQLPIENWVILEAHLEEETIASLLLIYSSDFVEYFTPVTLSEYKHLNPMSMLILHGFVLATKMKISFWNWGGTWLNQEGVYKFKKQWNPMEIKYTYHTTVLKPPILDVEADFLMSSYPFFYIYPFMEKN